VLNRSPKQPRVRSKDQSLLVFGFPLLVGVFSAQITDIQFTGTTHGPLPIPKDVQSEMRRGSYWKISAGKMVRRAQEGNLEQAGPFTVLGWGVLVMYFFIVLTCELCVWAVWSLFCMACRAFKN